jgi:aspartyl-tRNA(Asn)/glutamyl-tRNA(Gln) amidotransferase subunit B
VGKEVSFMQHEAVIGLEVHAQLLTNSKIFCGCSTTFGADPNTHTCPVCLGMPGVLPVLNRKVVEFTLMMALATKCRIAPFSRFARKNYFYPDLPKGYQISQYELPLAEDGYVDIEINGNQKRIGIIRIHMEEDAGKLTHDEKLPFSYIDFNRTGVPLIEIVSAPDIRTPEQASAYLKELRDILVYLEICDGNMEEGSFRCDANVSVRPLGQREFGTRTELKNMNSFRHVQRAIRYEIHRQIDLLERGDKVIQETRLWDEQNQRTYPMRGKEEAHDYRYFADPDLVPMEIDEPWIEDLRKRLPELPREKKDRFQKQYQELTHYDIDVLASSRALADYFEESVKYFAKPKEVSNWIMGDLLRELNRSGGRIEDCLITPSHLAEMLNLLDSGSITRSIAQTVFEKMYSSGKRAGMIVEDEGLQPVVGQLEDVVMEVLAEHPKEVEQYRAGKDKLIGFFMGKVMKATAGKGDPKLANQLLREKLKG